MYPITTKYAGDLLVPSNTMHLADPCYDHSVWCQIILTNVYPGQWGVWVSSGVVNDLGYRIHSITAISQDYGIPKLESWKECPGGVGVDSGQAGFLANFPDSATNKEVWEEFYENACSKTTKHPYYGFADESNFVAASGFGDGGYTAYQIQHDGMVTGLKIMFINTDDDDDDDGDILDDDPRYYLIDCDDETNSGADIREWFGVADEYSGSIIAFFCNEDDALEYTNIRNGG